MHPLEYRRRRRAEQQVERDRSAAANAVTERLAALDTAVAAGAGRLAEDQLAPARELARRAGERLRLSGSHTVVALAGATGSGKSSLFNALAGAPVSAVGVRRPTTGLAHAVIWGAQGAGPLLDWLQIPRRHYLSFLDHPDDGDHRLDGLVLLDLPDHDSTTVHAPARGGPAGRSGRRAGLGAGPAEVRRRRRARALPAAAGRARRGHGGRAEPGRPAARPPGRARRSTTFAGCWPPTGWARSRCWPPRPSPRAGWTGCARCWPTRWPRTWPPCAGWPPTWTRSSAGLAGAVAGPARPELDRPTRSPS